MDVSEWDRSQLREFCKEHGLPTNGGNAALRERILDVLAVDAVVDVWYPRKETFRRGIVTQVLHGCGSDA